MPRLTVHNSAIDRPSRSRPLDSEGYQSLFYGQTLDHFNYQPQSYLTFKQRYVLNSKYWKGAEASAPIFAFLGEEASLDSDLDAIGFLNENAAQFGALIVFMEHRFYGESVPFVSREEALKNATLRGYFNSAQALADYAEILLYVKKDFSAYNSPIIVFGGSYGGMLAAWFRLKYPHIALGALASSAPLLYVDGLTPHSAFFYVVTNDFREASESCYTTIKNSWAEIERISNLENGLSILSNKFRTCEPLKDAKSLKLSLELMYLATAQYDRPPTYGVNVICNAIDSAPPASDILDRIFSGVVAHYGDASCYNLGGYLGGSSSPDETQQGWAWQVCSDIVVELGVDTNDTMFVLNPYDANANNEHCMETYGVVPRRNWITTYHGGQNIREVLKKFGSNIIFSNGLRDPWSSGGILEDISDTIVAVKTNEGSHCLDVAPSREDDPDWLVMQRRTEVEIISKWITDYYEAKFKQ
ncbi:uncharacterized protein LOC110657800 [Hevea brasiliensis]|nr:uncharacterized protein LOC110657800 [Hevea brasiliensis]